MDKRTGRIRHKKIVFPNIKKRVCELNKWQTVKDYIGTKKVSFGPYFSYQFLNTPRRILFTLSHYKFAAKIIGEGKDVLEVGCSEGLGTLLLAEFANKVTGVDIDKDAIKEAKKNFASRKIRFRRLNFLNSRLGKFDAFASFDVIEHIYPENEDIFFKSICNSLTKDGICIIGTPNETSDQYASEVTKLGHVNLYSWEKLRNKMRCYFKNVMIFSANDEIVHTGFYPMAHYLIAVGINKK